MMTPASFANRVLLASFLSIVSIALCDPASAQAIGGVGSVGGAGDPLTVGNFYLTVFLGLCALVLVAMWVAVGFMMWRGMAGLVSIAGAAGGTVIILCAAYFASGGGGGILSL